MVWFRYGEWSYICRYSPQPICNLLFRQLLIHPERGTSAAPDRYLNLPTDPAERQTFISEAGLGVNPSCSIPRMASVGGLPGSVGNVANIVMCALSVLLPLFMCRIVSRRRAAVGRVEMLVLLVIYSLACLLQLLDTSTIMIQGSRVLVWITALHQCLIVSFFAILVWFGTLGFQFLEDGTAASLGLISGIAGTLGISSAYIFLDTAFGITSYFSSKPPGHLYSPWTFSLVILWPVIACFIYGVSTTLVITHRLGERKPLVYLLAATLTLILAEAARYGLSHVLCLHTSGSVDGSFLGTILETAALGWVVCCWIAITEADWDDFEAWDPGPPG